MISTSNENYKVKIVDVIFTIIGVWRNVGKKWTDIDLGLGFFKSIDDSLSY